MINPKALLTDLGKLLPVLEDDLREQCERVPELGARLQAEYAAAKDADRTGEPFMSWREQQQVQAAAAWVLGCVFVRFLEDNRLIDEPLLSGPGYRPGRARDRRTLYFPPPPRGPARAHL